MNQEPIKEGDCVDDCTDKVWVAGAGVEVTVRGLELATVQVVLGTDDELPEPPEKEDEDEEEELE